MSDGIETVPLSVLLRGDAICDDEGEVEEQHVNADCAEPKLTSERADEGCTASDALPSGGRRIWDRSSACTLAPAERSAGTFSRAVGTQSRRRKRDCEALARPGVS